MAESTQLTIVKKGCFVAIRKKIWELGADSELWKLWVTWDARAVGELMGLTDIKLDA